MEPISYGESFRAGISMISAGAAGSQASKTVEAWESTSSGAAAPSEIIDLAELESEGEGAAEVASGCTDRE